MNTMVTEMPVIGAALAINGVEMPKQWLFEKDRDLEIQDFVFPDVLEGDWQDIVNRYKRLLEGYKGRVGIHGPFFGLDLAASDPDIQSVIRKRLLQGLDACEALDATHMVVHSPFTHWQHQNFGHSDQLRTGSSRPVTAFLRRLFPARRTLAARW